MKKCVLNKVFDCKTVEL